MHKNIVEKKDLGDFLVVVDVQPGYETAFHEILPDIIERINTTTKPIIFFYVGRESDLDSKDDVIGYLLENGIDESVLDTIKFIEKDYGFFRNWMDTLVPHDLIINAISLMHQEKIHDSRGFDDSHWKTILNGNENHPHLIFEEMINYPSFYNGLFTHADHNNFELIGGGRHECLEEINLYLKGLGKTTYIDEDLCYGADLFNPHENTTKKKKRKH